MLYFSGKGCSEFPKKVLILIGILRSCMELLKLAEKYSPEKLEQVCFINLLFSAVDDKIKAQ